MLQEFIQKHQKVCFCTKKYTFFAKRLKTHSFDYLKYILRTCSEDFNSHFQMGQFLCLAQIKSHQKYQLSIFSCIKVMSPMLYFAFAGYTPSIARYCQPFDLFAFHQRSHTASLVQKIRAFCILSEHVPVCPIKFNSTLKIYQYRALFTMAIGLELPSDWCKTYCE